VDALAGRCRVITFSLADEPTCDATFDAAHGFESYVDQVRDAMDQAGVSKAAICGVSYGGLIAAAFAARHPERVASLLMVSAIPPSWCPDSRVRFYLRAPVLLSPLFLVGSTRMYKEIAAAHDGVLQGMAAAARHALNALTHMFSPARMARRVHLLDTVKLDHELERVSVPTLVMTGDDALDRIVPTRLTQEYLRIWPHARSVSIARTGHLGLITRPRAFATAVASFVEAIAGTEEQRRVG
jgi:pimeloyl-ACP methyl ester carboxylesterase